MSERTQAAIRAREDAKHPPAPEPEKPKKSKKPEPEPEPVEELDEWRP